MNPFGENYAPALPAMETETAEPVVRFNRIEEKRGFSARFKQDRSKSSHRCAAKS
jgi:hypothetical protein